MAFTAQAIGSKTPACRYFPCSNTSHLRDVGKLLSNETDSTERSLIELITLLNKLTLLNYISILAL